MNKNATLVMVLLAGLTVGTWGYLYNNVQETEDSYVAGVQRVALLEEKGIYIDAVAEYKTLLEMNPKDYDLLIRYAIANRKLGDEAAFRDACGKASAVYPEKAEPYLLLAQYYLDRNKEKDAYALLSKVKSQPLDDVTAVDAMLKTLQGMYDSAYRQYTETGIWHDGFMPVSYEGKWGTVDLKGEQKIKYTFEAIGAYSAEEEVMPVCQEGLWFYADAKGNRKLISEKAYKALGGFGNGWAPAYDGSHWGYIDRNFKEGAFEYEVAGMFSHGVAAVKKDGKWALIDSSLKPITEFVYDDIKLDYNQACAPFGRVFASKDGKYSLLDTKGQVVGKETFEDVQLFASEQPAAVKQKGKWGYVAQDGSIAIAPTYDGAASFSVGLAPFCKGELWGVINSAQEVIIEPSFDFLSTFTPEGSALSKTGNSWRFIQMYSYEKTEQKD